MKASQGEPSASSSVGAPKQLKASHQFLIMLFPIILFTLAEEWGGLLWALILSVIYALGEVFWEWKRYRSLSGLTLFSNGMVVGLSLVSYFTQEGFWFKLQPAILELAMALVLLGTSWRRRPLLISMLEQQGQVLSDEMRVFFSGLNSRMGIFFIAQSCLAAYASFYWSTEIWAFLKSIGILIMMVIYMIVEILILKRRQRVAFSGVPRKELDK